MANVWKWCKTILAIIGGIAIAVVVMRRSGLSGAAISRGVVADTRESIDSVGRDVRRTREGIRIAQEGIDEGQASIERSHGIIDELDSALERGRSIIDDIRGQGGDPDTPA